MVFYQPKHNPIIKLHLQKLMNEVFECSNDYARKNHRRILQSKRHYSVLKTFPFSHKGRLASIFRHDFDLMVPKKPISEGVHFLATYIIQYLISE